MKAFLQHSLAILMAGAAALATAQDHQHAGNGAHEASAPNAAATLTEGEVRKIDKEAGKITLRHGEIRNLNMAAMTMVLRVQDPAMLDQVEVGDKVQFAAERLNGAITIVQMQKAQ
ncbi:copper-binding protein [Massilia alkalitolerans]|jgi:Cu(I)/Ag(I) efflux system protein CusF|uniref:copper-binding protein n=1 Tax=Massilia alkalitolerans TaxID=286638 RepID=UPI000423A7FF|nr:copper-binding protein [Massilia alkalitolerans]